MKKKLLLCGSIFLVVLVVAVVAVSVNKAKEEQRVEDIIGKPPAGLDSSEEGNSSDKENAFDEKDIIEAVQQGVISSGYPEYVDVDKRMVTLQEARDSLDALMEKGQNGEYRNLNFTEFTPMVTGEDVVCKLVCEASDFEDGLTISNIEKMVDAMRVFYGDELDERYITDDRQDSLEEVKKQIEEGDYGRDFLCLSFHKDEYHMQVGSGITALWVDLGMEGNGVNPRCLIDKVYYANASDGSLEDVYETQTGKMSVKEAIAEVEMYFNEQFPLEVETEYVYRVYKVWIMKTGENRYAFNFGMRRTYKGVPFEYARSGTFAYEHGDYIDMMEAVLQGKGDIVFFNAFSPRAAVRIEESYDRVISPEAVIEYVSQKIGENTVYKTVEMDLSYTSKMDDDAEETATPTWTIIMVNGTTGRETRIYVNAVTGETIYRQM